MRGMDTAVIPLPTPAEAAIAASGLAVTDAELPRLARLVERRLPADAAAVRDALVGLRRRGWAAQLEALAREAGRLWVTRDDARRAADRVSEPEPGEAGLLAALDQVLHRRLRDAGDTAKATVLAVLAELEEAGTTLDPERTEELARSAAAAHGLDAGATDKLAAAALLGARERQAERREVEALARAAKREELRRLRAWEASLVPFARVAELLGCTQREALRWIGRQHAARRASHRHGEGQPQGRRDLGVRPRPAAAAARRGARLARRGRRAGARAQARPGEGRRPRRPRRARRHPRRQRRRRPGGGTGPATPRTSPPPAR